MSKLSLIHGEVNDKYFDDTEDKINPYNVLNFWRKQVCNSELHKTCKLILLLMSVCWMDEELYCFPSMRLIAEKASCDKNTVAYHIKRAKQLGWLEIEKRKGSKQGWKCNAYRGKFPDSCLSKSCIKDSYISNKRV